MVRPRALFAPLLFAAALSLSPLTGCSGDDVPEGKVTSFPMAVKRKDDETVVFSWITWPSRKVRDDAWKKVMEDQRLKPETNPMPFDGKRLIYGGFETLFER